MPGGQRDMALMWRWTSKLWKLYGNKVAHSSRFAQYTIQMMHASEWTLKYYEREVLTSRSSYFIVA